MSASIYEEAQENEIEALRSIFESEFQLVTNERKLAWNKLANPAFSIQVDITENDLSRSGHAGPFPSVSLHVEYTAQYPKTAPRVVLSDASNLSVTEFSRLKDVLHDKVVQLTGSEMIYDLVDVIKSELTQIMRKKETPSLIEERTSRLQKIEAMKLEKQALQQETARKLRADKNESLQSQIQEELKSKTKILKQPAQLPLRLELSDGSGPQIILARPIQIENYMLDALPYGVPLVQKDSSITRPRLLFLPEIGHLVVKEYTISSMYPETLPSIEAAISRTTINNDGPNSDFIGIQNYGCSLLRVDSLTWKLSLVQQYASHGSLRDLLGTAGAVNRRQAKRWLHDLAAQLSIAHRHGFIHRNITSSNVLLSEDEGKVVAKLSDWDYSYLIHKQDVYFEGSRVSLTDTMEPRPSGRRADDIADLGVVFLEMIFGLGVNQARSVEDILKQNRSELDSELTALLSSIFASDARQRPTASDLLSYQYLRSSNEPSITSSQPSTHYDTKISRYNLDFEELSSIGSGGFGRVVKARNRLDNRIYAIKIIPNFNESRVLREVSGLARLNHPSIVRYFASWVEETKAVIEIGQDDSSNSSISYESVMSPDDFMSTSGIVFAHSGNGPQEVSATDSKVQQSIPGSLRARALFIQMEYCSGNTLRTLIDGKQIGHAYWNYLSQIVEGVQYIHRQGLIHRDLKPANIFVSSEGLLKLGDFGLASESTADVMQTTMNPVFQDDERTGDVGTFLYQAPELSTTNPSYDFKIDVMKWISRQINADVL